MRANTAAPTTYMALSKTEEKKKKVLNWVFLRQWVYCSGTLSITFLVMWGGGWGEGEINVVLNTHTYSSLSTIPNMYIIYQHRRDDRPLELWGKSQTLTYDDWHWALQLVKKIYKWRTWGMFSSVFSLKTTDLGAFLSETVQNMACTLVCYERKTPFLGEN